MVFVEAFLDEEWESVSNMFSIGENNPDLSLFPTCDENIATAFIFSSCNDHHTILHTNFYSCVSQESTNSMDDGVNFHHHEELTSNKFHECMNYYTNMMVPVFSGNVIMEEMFNNEQLGGNNAETDDCCKESTQLKRNYQAEEEEDEPTAEEYGSSQRPKRKPRVSRNNAQKNQRPANFQSKKKKKETIQDDENNNEEMTIDGGGGNNNQSTSICGSEDHDSITNASESKSSGKAKANRGSATDPQSLYARRRRERINERLKLLQSLVPNGTKVDISTMLEEAVQYVKFLQLQIKLLSSDDLWMYAPIAYNGMDISMYQKISPNFCL